MRPLPFLVTFALLPCAAPSYAQIATTLDGAPVQVQPTALEPGVPAISVNPGTPNPFPSSPAGGPSSDPSSGSGTTSGGSGSDGSGSGSAVLSTLLAQPFGIGAVNAAAQLGVSGTAIAATCVMESGCSASTGANGTISGTFQMKDSTYLQMVQEVGQRDPALAATIPAGLAGKNDPAVQAIAASQYLYDGAKALQAAGVANPTVTDARTYFQFGPTNGTVLATALPDQLISSVVSLTPAQWKANGLDPATSTIGQWRQTITKRVGASAANASALSS
jgi:hypothetical protein